MVMLSGICFSGNILKEFRSWLNQNNCEKSVIQRQETIFQNCTCTCTRDLYTFWMNGFFCSMCCELRYLVLVYIFGWMDSFFNVQWVAKSKHDIWRLKYLVALVLMRPVLSGNKKVTSSTCNNPLVNYVKKNVLGLGGLRLRQVFAKTDWICDV